jgi:hypothetical protein
VTRGDIERRARDLYARLWKISENAVEEAVAQAGLPPVFAWDLLAVAQMRRLSVALNIRLMEAVA